MLIGLIGGMNVGKDLTHELIRDVLNDQIFEHKKFATKIKKMLATLIDCTVEDLENREFKNTPISWLSCYKFDAVGETKCFISKKEALNYLKINSLPESLFEIKHFNPTPRYLMQSLGTTWGRDIINPNVWVLSLLKNYNSKKNWIVSDVRFGNEMSAIEQLNGVLIQITRPYKKRFPKEYKKYERYITEHKDVGFLSWLEKNNLELYCILTHPSETLEKNISDTGLNVYKIENNGTIQDLREKLRKLFRTIVK